MLGRIPQCLNGLVTVRGNSLKIIKETKTNGTLIFREIPYQTAKNMMVKYHYSHKWNTSFGLVNIGVFRDGTLLGAAVFGNLMNPNSYKKLNPDFDKENVVELNRLWIDDELGYNAETTLIGASFKIIKKLYPYIYTIQSFADGRLGCGTIYKAANFKYYGHSNSVFLQDINSKELFHKVPLENTKRPTGFLNKNRLYLDNKLRAFKVKTYRYIYCLNKTKEILLPELPYPPYEKGMTDTVFTHSENLLARLSVMYKLIGDDEYANKALKLINPSNLNYVLEQAHTNPSIKWFCESYLKNPRNLIDLKKLPKLTPQQLKLL